MPGWPRGHRWEPFLLISALSGWPSWTVFQGKLRIPFVLVEKVKETHSGPMKHFFLKMVIEKVVLFSLDDGQVKVTTEQEKWGQKKNLLL